MFLFIMVKQICLSIPYENWSYPPISTDKAMYPRRGRGANQDPHAAVCQAADDLVEEGQRLQLDYT